MNHWSIKTIESTSTWFVHLKTSRVLFQHGLIFDLNVHCSTLIRQAIPRTTTTLFFGNIQFFAFFLNFSFFLLVNLILVGSFTSWNDFQHAHLLFDEHSWKRHYLFFVGNKRLHHLIVLSANIVLLWHCLLHWYHILRHVWVLHVWVQGLVLCLGKLVLLWIHFCIIIFIWYF